MHLLTCVVLPSPETLIYTTNWIGHLSQDFRRVIKMRTAMPNEEVVITFMGIVAMVHKPFDRTLPYISDKTLFHG